MIFKIIIKASEIQIGDYFPWDCLPGQRQVTKVEKDTSAGVPFIYVYFGGERKGYEYWDCDKYFPRNMVVVGREKP